jgi:hypothetical protein
LLLVVVVGARLELLLVTPLAAAAVQAVIEHL